MPVFLPRFIRLRDAPTYLGMDRNRFNFEVRPVLIEIPIGRQGIAFDRIELDLWADECKRRNGRRPSTSEVPAVESEDTPESDCTSKAEGRSRTCMEKGAFAKALEVAASRKRR